MSMDDLYAKPGHLIRRAQQIIVGMFMEECATFDITPVQYACLIAARENPGLDATRLSYLIAFDRSTLGKVLDRLEAKELIRRSGTAHDRRVKTVELTKEGARLLAAVEPAVQRAQQRFLGRLPADEQRRFMTTLTRLVELNNEYSRAPLRVVTGD
ncbi:MAG: MarR family transcriptional regulator [Bradyrhizobium sp.]|uniref:MarR family winged helix-turn-helix transcriptional regulator n=1 Tax=Bradyrhizobium sp. TaxID=376 RepID=UPI0025C6711D|nr:MarR family transcriptional regulator [Bradyrhizobium sp.]MBI5265235.1 MarR family transcriptional regulator [Bradyrhizobium sp.]